MKIDDTYTLTLIKRQYRKVLLTGRIKTILQRTKRLDEFYKHITKTYK
jgi:hypothetical protein